MDKGKSKVIMVTNYYFPTVGGISTYISTLVSGLARENIESEVLCYPQNFRNWEARSNSKGAKRFLHSILLLFFISFAEWRILKNRIGNKKLIVHSHSANFCLYIAVLSRALGCRTVHTYHSPISKSFRELESLTPKVDAVVFVSEEAKKLYQSHMKIKNDRIEIIPGVIDQSRYRPRNRDEIKGMKEDLSELLGAKHSSKKLIVFVGRVIEDKGVMPLVKSIKIVKKAVPDVYLIIVGPHSREEVEKRYYDKITSYVTENKLENSILFTGPGSLDMVMKLYAVCRVVVCPSLWEASGIVPIEAMASGKPVVASKVGGLQLRVIDGKTGFLVEKDNPGDLADKIILLLRDEKLWIKMCKNARKHVEKNYTHESMIDGYKKLYDTIIK